MALATPVMAPLWKVKPSHFSLAISALNIGAVVGSALIAPFGDTLGRKRIISLTMLMMGVCVAATATASNVTALAFWRFLSGLALGAAVINVTAFITEKYPRHRQALFLTIASTNLSLGGVLGGFSGAGIMHSLSWRGIFLIGGVCGIVLSILLYASLAADSPDLKPKTAGETPPPPRVSVVSLLSPSLLGITLPLWIIRFLNAAVMFVLLSWLPTMLKSIGWSLGDASRGSAMMQVGGIIAGIVLSWLLDQGRATTALAIAFISMIVVFLLFSFIPPTVAIWSLLLVLGGGFSMGAHFALNALAATLYPPSMRATGSGWAGAMSRIGSIGGSLLGGLFLFLHFEVGATISLLALPTACSLALTALLQTHKRRMPALDAAVSPAFAQMPIE